MSETFEFLAVGGGPAGMSAVRAYRKAGGEGAVAIVTDEGRMPYERPALSKELLRGEIDEDALALEDESWLVRESVSLVAGRAMHLDRGRMELALAGGRRLAYRRLVIATGAEPTRPAIAGADDAAVRTLRSLDDLRELQARLGSGVPVIVIGSGFIGCEVAASLTMAGHPVTLISDEPAPNQRRLGPEAAEVIAGWLRQLGVTLLLGVEVERIERRDGGLRVHAGTARPHSEVIVMATGVSPRSELLAGFGLVGAEGAVAVDAGMRTGILGVFAAGDVALAHNVAAGRAVRVEHWGDALAQGAIAGRNAAGHAATWDEVPGFWSTIGRRTLKYAAWGDGYDVSRVQRDDQSESFAIWYGRAGRVVGVLSHDLDHAYDSGRTLIAEGAAWMG